MTLRMQKYFMCNFNKQVESSAIQHHKRLKERLAPLEEEILKVDNVQEEDADKLYKKIVFFITLQAGLGNPTVNSVSSTFNVL